jgi:hypothetical protein
MNTTQLKRFRSLRSSIIETFKTKQKNTGNLKKWKQNNLQSHFMIMKMKLKLYMEASEKSFSKSKLSDN